MGGFEELSLAIDEYIHFYNHKRLQKRLNGLSSIEYRTKAASLRFIFIISSVYLTGCSSFLKFRVGFLLISILLIFNWTLTESYAYLLSCEKHCFSVSGLNGFIFGKGKRSFTGSIGSASL